MRGQDALDTRGQDARDTYQALLTHVLRIGTIIFLASLVAAGHAAGQLPDAPPTRPILKVIPAGSVGYVLIHDVKKATDVVDRFLKETGLAQFVEDDMPAGCL